MGYIREGPDYRALVRAMYTIPTTSVGYPVNSPLEDMIYT